MRIGCSHCGQILPAVGLQYPPGRRKIPVFEFTHPEPPRDTLSFLKNISLFPTWMYQGEPESSYHSMYQTHLWQAPQSLPNSFWSPSYLIWSTPSFPMGKEGEEPSISPSVSGSLPISCLNSLFSLSRLDGLLEARIKAPMFSHLITSTKYKSGSSALE